MQPKIIYSILFLRLSYFTKFKAGSTSNMVFKIFQLYSLFFKLMGKSNTFGNALIWILELMPPIIIKSKIIYFTLNMACCMKHICKIFALSSSQQKLTKGKKYYVLQWALKPQSWCPHLSFGLRPLCSIFKQKIMQLQSWKKVLGHLSQIFHFIVPLAREIWMLYLYFFVHGGQAFVETISLPLHH